MLDQQLHTDRYMSSPSQSDPPTHPSNFPLIERRHCMPFRLRKAMGAAFTNV